jgi:hypothetical protein
MYGFCAAGMGRGHEFSGHGQGEGHDISCSSLLGGVIVFQFIFSSSLPPPTLVISDKSQYVDNIRSIAISMIQRHNHRS